MKKSILFSIINIFLLSVCIAQTDTTLQLIKRQNGKIVVIKENKKISVIRFDNKRLSGKLDIVSDSSIAINSDTILLKNINEIRKKSLGLSILGFLAAYMGGEISAGFFIILFTVINDIGLNSEAMAITILFSTISFPFLAAGVLGIIWGVKKLFIGNKYPHTKWIYKIAHKPIAL